MNPHNRRGVAGHISSLTDVKISRSDVRDAGISYVVSRWGSPTQTFVRREAKGVRDLGIGVDALSLKQPIRAGGVDVAWLPARAVLAGLLRAAVHDPRRTLSLLATVRSARLRNVPALLVATVIGLAWSGSGLVTKHLHSHFGWVAGAAARAAALHAGVGYSVVYHAFDLHTHVRADGFAALVAQSADQAFVIVESDIEVLEASFGVTPELLRMGVTDEWLEAPVSVRANGRHIMSVGSLLPKKGHADLIRALALAESDWSLTIVGDGPLESELRSLIDRLGLDGRVTLKGLVEEDEVRRLLGTADVFVLASVETESGDRDGVPVALMEAMAAGVPVIASDVGGIPELVDGAGILVPPGRADAIAAELLALRDEGRRLELATLGRARIERGWTVDASAARVARLTTPVGISDRVPGSGPDDPNRSHARAS